jgi:hypothetical protein
MPSITGLAELDAAIGLAFMFFLLATAVSSINELIASYLGWRAKTLEDGLRSMFGDPKVTFGLRAWGRSLLGLLPKSVTDRLAEKRLDAVRDGQTTQADADNGKLGDLTTTLFEHWRIKALVRDPEAKSRRRRRPSYLPPAALSRALMEQLAALGTQAPGTTASNTGPGPTAWAQADNKLFEQVQRGIGNLAHESPALAEAVEKALRKPEAKLEEFRKAVEGWFDQTMDRASGWYKRKVQVVVVLIAAALAIGLNVDSVHVASRLWKEPALRSAVAARATDAAESAGGQATGSPSAQEAADEIDKVKQLNLPVGWAKNNRPSGFSGWVGGAAGWLITIAAISLGAPFWFDVLSRLARLRGSGSPTAPRDLSDKQPSKAAG